MNWWNKTWNKSAVMEQSARSYFLLINFHIGIAVICVAVPLVSVMHREGSLRVIRALSLPFS
jgi:uncharacterized membrane protein YozB (DUF420 family)